MFAGGTYFLIQEFEHDSVLQMNSSVIRFVDQKHVLPTIMRLWILNM
jgi:hypothetical protein